MKKNTNLEDALEVYLSNNCAEAWNALLVEMNQAEFLAPCQIEGEIVDTDTNGGIIIKEGSTLTFLYEQFDEDIFCPVFTDIKQFEAFYPDANESAFTVTIKDIIFLSKDAKIDGFVINPNRECLAVRKNKSSNRYLCLGGLTTMQNYINILILTVVLLAILGALAWFYLHIR